MKFTLQLLSVATLAVLASVVRAIPAPKFEVREYPLYAPLILITFNFVGRGRKLDTTHNVMLQSPLSRPGTVRSLSEYHKGFERVYGSKCSSCSLSVESDELL